VLAAICSSSGSPVTGLVFRGGLRLGDTSDVRQQTIDPNADATTIFTDDSFFVLEDMHPERAELLCSYRRGRSQLYRLTLASGDLEQVSDHRLIRGARYSPDGHWIAINTAYTVGRNYLPPYSPRALVKR
jgi:Tol biopolymer transport system component